jgi:hypothetical protein
MLKLNITRRDLLIAGTLAAGGAGRPPPARATHHTPMVAARPRRVGHNPGPPGPG